MGKLEGLNYYDVKKIDSIRELLDLAVEEAGNKLAFKYKQNGKIINVTYKEFNEDTNHLGTALCNINMQDKHIAVIGENSFKWLTVYLTALKSSGVFVPIDKELPKDDIINLLVDSDSEILFFSKRYSKYIDEFIEKAPKIKYFIGFDQEEETDKILSYNKFILNGKKLFDEGSKDYLSLKSNPNDLKMLVYTSGTTGMAKGVMLTEHNLVSCVYYGLQVSTVFDCCLSVLPYHHTYEAVAGILVALHHHSTICINDNLKSVLKNLQLYKPDYIYHAAAYKHVPLMEDSPAEAIRTNVIGTYNVARLADKYHAKKMVLVSTDKAVRPTNVMGATKRFAETIIQYYAEHSETKYAAVRFGNVLGSNGSVVPLFKKQIEAGGPVTITDKNITRYFMTIPEAVSLILQCGLFAEGGEIFILDMGKPVKIYDLAQRLIRQAGFVPNKDIKIIEVGLRPGEKLYEELLLNKDEQTPTDNKKIFIEPTEMVNEKVLEDVEKASVAFGLEESKRDVKELLETLITTYTITEHDGK